MIPKIIHIIAFNKLNLLNNYVVNKCFKSHEILIKHNYEIIIWDEINLSPYIDNFISKLLFEKKYAFASDLLRYKLLFEFGGIYIDTDIEVVKSPDILLNNTLPFFGYETHDKLTTSVIGSPKKSDLFLELYKKTYISFQKHHFHPSPFFLNTIKENNFDIICYPKDFFFPYNPFDDQPQLFYSDITENTIFIHHWNHSWKQDIITRIYLFIIRRFK
jgi:mannosyltransferase OCH1-like enzyme